MPESSELYTTTTREPFAIRKVSWGAIFSGVALFLVIQFTLSVLGAAIGFSAVEPGEEAQPMAGMGTGAAIWWICSMIVALFCAGWATAKLSTAWSRLSGTLHGLVTWAVSVVLLLWLLTSAIGSVVGGALSTLQIQSSSIGQIAPMIERRAEQMTPSQGGGGQAQQDGEYRTGDGGYQDQDGEMLQGGEGRQLAETATDWTASAAWWSFITLVLGALAAALGGGLGLPKRRFPGGRTTAGPGPEKP